MKTLSIKGVPLVLSEFARARPNVRVVARSDGQPEVSPYLSVLALGKL